MAAWGGVPPEIISGQLYAGPGSGGLREAAAAWAELAGELEAAARDYQTVLTGIVQAWQGPSATAMATAVTPYIAWLQSTAEQARLTGVSAAAAASSYETALAAAVPPPTIAANRSLLLQLITTNILGQYTGLIAALEAQYAQMWAQDTATMNTYEVSSLSAIAQLPALQPAPQVANLTANPAAVIPAQATPLDLINAILTLLGLDGSSPLSLLTYSLIQGLGTLPVDILGLFTSLLGPIAGASMIANQIGIQNSIIAAKPSAPMAVYPPTESKAVPTVKASAGTAPRLGPMRVPPSWAQPQSPQAATALPASQGGEKEEVPIGLPVIPAVPVTGGKGGQKKGTKFEDMDYGRPMPPILNRHPSGG
jgi:PPE-repeat protein